MKKLTILIMVMLMMFSCAGCAGCNKKQPDNTLTPTPTVESTATPTMEPTKRPTVTPTPKVEATATPTITPTSIPLVTPFVEPTIAPRPNAPIISRPTPMPTNTPTPIPTATPIPTSTPTPGPTSTPIPTPTPLPYNEYYIVYDNEEVFKLVSTENFNFESGEGDYLYYEFNNNYPLDTMYVEIRYVDDIDEFLSTRNLSWKNIIEYDFDDMEDLIGVDYVYLRFYENSNTEFVEMWVKGIDNILLNVAVTGTDIKEEDVYACYKEFFTKVLQK